MAGLTKVQLEEKLSEKSREVEFYQKVLKESEERNSQFQNAYEEAYLNTSVYKQQQQRIEVLENAKHINEKRIAHLLQKEEALQNHICALVEENKQLQESIKDLSVIHGDVHNARGAGRKPKPKEKTEQQVSEIERLLNEGKKEKEICAEMGISRSTYYRLKKVKSTNS